MQSLQVLARQNNRECLEYLIFIGGEKLERPMSSSGLKWADNDDDWNAGRVAAI
jgi:hypothetical protein